MKRNLKAALFLVGILMLGVAHSAHAVNYSMLKEVTSGSFGYLAGPTDVKVAPDGSLYIVDSSNIRILKLSPEGALISQWKGSSSSFFPQRIAIDGSGNFYYVSNFYNKIMKFSSSGELTSEWGSQGSGNGQFKAPSGMTIGSDGSIYVVDTDNNRIQKFNANGAFVTAWGSGGNSEGDFRLPRDITIGPGGILLVADTENNRIQAFTEAGEFIAEGGTRGTGLLQFISPEGVAMGPDGSIYVSDTGNNRIQRVSPDGTISVLGTGTLNRPAGIAVDNGGNVYVADNFNDRVVVFTPDIITFESGKKTKSITMPNALALTIDIATDTYWRGAAADIYVWLETEFQGTEYRLFFDGTWKIFNNNTELMPLAHAVNIPDALQGVHWEILSSTAGLPPVNLDFTICLDRNTDGNYNPSDAVCSTIEVQLK